ncbi:MAG: DUF2249 domain-containing protein [Myxococcales bacterium]|nr:DUF2249 domain-containing protein [Myxococcales bacterium]
MSQPRVTVDGRELFPPEPMQRVLAALATLAQGECLELLLAREPFPLYELLRRDGHTWRTRLEPDGTYVITITKFSAA